MNAQEKPWCDPEMPRKVFTREEYARMIEALQPRDTDTRFQSLVVRGVTCVLASE
jgi:hypothetical protein